MDAPPQTSYFPKMHLVETLKWPFGALKFRKELIRLKTKRESALLTAESDWRAANFLPLLPFPQIHLIQIFR